MILKSVLLALIAFRACFLRRSSAANHRSYSFLIVDFFIKKQWPLGVLKVKRAYLL